MAANIDTAIDLQNWLQEILTSKTKCRFDLKTFMDGGCCCWTVFYTPVPGVQISTKTMYRKAVQEILEDKPMKSKVVLTGRIGSSNYGIFITFGCRSCTRIQDFRNILTQFHLEPSSYLIVSDVITNRDYYDESEYLDNAFDGREVEILYKISQNIMFEDFLIIPVDMVDLKIFTDELVVITVCC